MLARKIESIVKFYQKNGINKLLRYFYHYIWTKYIYVCFRKKLTEPVERSLDIYGLKFEAIVSGEKGEYPWNESLEKLSSIYSEQKKRSSSWYENGDIVIVGKVGNILVYRSRLTNTDWLFNYMPTLLRKKSLYHTDVYVAPNWRKRGVAQDGLLFAEKISYEHNFQNIYAFVRQQKDASLSLHRKSDYEEFGKIIFKKIFGSIDIQIIERNKSE